MDNRMVPCRCRGVLVYHAECAGFVKMEISVSGIFRVEPFQHRLCGDSPSTDGGNVPAPRRGKRVDTKVSTLLTPTSFYFLVWRRLPTCDRCETGERQRIFSSVSFAIYSQGRIHYCYTDRLLSAGATYSCCATRKSGDNRRHLRIYAFDTIYLRRNCL